jgi:peptidoglycan/LPS O-acetylase OafA/YrhL
MSTARTRRADQFPPTGHGSNGRLAVIDGLRGWSSLSVVLSHLIFGVFVNAEPHLANQTIKNLLEPFLGGTFDVCVFFVLSGDALSSSHWRTPFQRDFVARLITRYVRLAVPIFVASFAVFILVKCDLIYVKEAGALLNSREWLGAFLQGNYTIGDVLSYSSANVFLRHDPHTDLIPFLWTMETEWFGSLATICYLFVEDLIPFKGKVLWVAFILCIWLDSVLACFFWYHLWTLASQRRFCKS